MHRTGLLKLEQKTNRAKRNRPLRKVSVFNHHLKTFSRRYRNARFLVATVAQIINPTLMND